MDPPVRIWPTTSQEHRIPSKLLLSRRTFLGQALGAGLVAAACAPAGAERPAASIVRPTALPSSAPLSTIFALRSDPPNLDPHVTDGFAYRLMQRMLLEPLVDYVGEGKFAPLLAESWTNPDPLTYVFKLARNAKFQDGSPVSGDAVRWNFERLFALRRAGSVLLPPIAKTETVDPATVKITLKTPFAPFVETLCSSLLIVNPESVKRPGDEWGERLAAEGAFGSGPFRLTAGWTRTQPFSVSVDGSYWKGKAPNAVPQIAIRNVKEPTVQRLLIETGEVALADGVAQEDLPGLMTIKGLAVDSEDGSTTIAFFIRQRGPLTNRRIRQAIQLGFDYDRVKSIFPGRSEPANGPFPPAVWANDSTAPLPKKDPEQARKLFTSSEPGGPIQLVVGATAALGGYALRLAGLMVDSLKEIGIAARTEERADLAAYQSWLSSPGGPDLALWSYSWTTEDPDEFLRRCFHSSAIPPVGLNFGQYRSAEIDRLINDGVRPARREDRAPIYRQISRALTDDAAAVWVAHPRSFIVRRAFLNGFPVTPLLGSYAPDLSGLYSAR